MRRMVLAVVVGGVFLVGCDAMGVTQEFTEPHGDDWDMDDGDMDELYESEAEVPPRDLTVTELERYYDAQVSWRACAMEAAAGLEGAELAPPASRADFVASGGEVWSVGNEASELNVPADPAATGGPEEYESVWDFMVAACGWAPSPDEYRVEEEALRRLHAFQLDLVTCLATQGYPVDGTPPTEDAFVEAGGHGWSVWQQLRERYTVGDHLHERLNAACGSSVGELPLDLHSFEIDRDTLERRYEGLLALARCLEDAGFVLSDPPSREAYLAGDVGTNWDPWLDADAGNVQDWPDIGEACPDGW